MIVIVCGSGRLKSVVDLTSASRRYVEIMAAVADMSLRADTNEWCDQSGREQTRTDRR